MPDGKREWWPLDVAAEKFGYHPESLRRRLRQLRQLGSVVDLGRPPDSYKVSQRASEGKIILQWPNPDTALLRSDAPPELLNPRRGKRPRPQH